MAQETGTAYVTLLPTTRGWSGGVTKELSGAFDQGERHGSSALGGLFKRAVGWAGAAAVAIGGYFSAKKIFGGGLDRLLNIEDAQAKLRGLGHDATAVQRIMGDALNAVRGTAYGLDSAATVAATAVAAGIKPGQELEKYLRLTADAATIAGVSLDEMGSILNKTTTSGKVYTAELNQLADRGLPIFQWLQDEYGVTAEALRDMVSKGQVDAETFRRVIEENIGGAALASGDTTRGALANLGAALSRIGANLLSGVFPLFKEGAQGITAALGPIEDTAKRVGESFGAWATGTLVPAVRGVAALLRGDFTPALTEAFGWQEDAPIVGAVLGIVEGITGAMARVGPAISSVTSFVGPLLSGIGPQVMAGLAPIAAAVGSLVQAFAPLLPQVMQAVSAFNPLSLILRALLPVLPQIAGLLGDLGATVIGALAPVFAQVVPIIAQLAGTLTGVLVQAITALLPVITGVLPIITTLAGILGDVLLTAVTAVAPIIEMLAGVIVSLLPALTPVIGAVLAVVQALLPLVDVAAQLIGALLPPLVSLLMALLGPVLALIGPLVGALAPVLQLVATIISGALVPIVRVLTTVLAAVLRAVLPVVSVILGGLVTAITTLIRWVAQAAGGIASFVSTGINAIRGFATAVASSIGGALDWFRRLPSTILSAVGNLGNLLYTAGRNVIQGLIRGVTSMVGAVGDAIGGVVTKIRNFLPFSPAKEGPLSGRGAPDLAGRKVAEMLAHGLAQGEALVGTRMTSLLDGHLAVAAHATLTGPAGANRGPDPVNLDPRSIDDLIAGLLAAVERGTVGALSARDRAEAGTRTTRGVTW